MNAPVAPLPATATLVVEALGRPPQRPDPVVMSAVEAEVAEMESALALLQRRETLAAELNARGVDLADLVVQSETMASICATVARYFDRTVAELKGPQTAPDLVLPRHIAIAVMCSRHRWSLPQIGRFMGGRDHTTALNARRRIYARLDAALAAQGWRAQP